MFQSQRELLAAKHQAAELDPLSIGGEKIFRNGDNLGTSREYGLCIQRLERGPWKIDGALEGFCNNKNALLYNHAQEVKHRTKNLCHTTLLEKLYTKDALLSLCFDYQLVHS